MQDPGSSLDPWKHLAHCDVCIDSHPLQDFRFYRCGHGFCENSINEMKRHDRIGVCPTCRSDIRGEEPTRLYIKFIDLGSPSDALTKQVASVANCLANLDTSPTVDMVEDAGMKLGRIQCTSSDNDELSKMLSGALKDFHERIEPILSSTRTLQDRIQDLTQQRKCLREKAAGQEQLSQARMTEIHDLRAKLADQSRLRELESQEVRRLREENRSLQKAREVVIRHLANEERKDAELAESREYGIKYKNKWSATKTKLNALSQENKLLKRKLSKLQAPEENDESLRVLDEGLAIDGTAPNGKENDLIVADEPDPPASHARRPSNSTVHHHSARPVVRVVSTSSVVAENLHANMLEIADRFHTDLLDDSSSPSKSKRRKADPRKVRDTTSKSESANTS